MKNNAWNFQNGGGAVYRKPSISANSFVRLPKTFHCVLAFLLIGVLLTLVNVYTLRHLQTEHWERSHSENRPEIPTSKKEERKPLVWIKANEIENGYLDHVIEIFQRLGYARGTKESEWDVLWHHDYPFLDDDMRPVLLNLLPYQKVNHIPGSGFYTSKVSLATSNVSGVPPAFSLPNQKNELLAYAGRFPDKFWVQKDNRHRGIQIKKIEELNLTQENSFIQEYVANPLLIDKRKFDIGIYTVITSVQPLRVYTFEGEALLRFCPEDYYPFDPKNFNKYVVHDDYTPVWELPALKKYYSDFNYNRKESLNAYLRMGMSRDPGVIWKSIHKTIGDVLRSKSPFFASFAKAYKSTRNFFELSRFDFVVDENFSIFLMEANMSPNLSSGHFAGNKLMYEQVIYNLLALVGIGRMISSGSLKEENEAENQMQVSDRDILVYAEICALNGAACSCSNWKCRLCSHCVTDEWKLKLKDAYLEHHNRLNMRRVIPEPLDSEAIQSEEKFVADHIHLDEENRLMAWWFRGKCIQDRAWCT